MDYINFKIYNRNKIKQIYVSQAMSGNYRFALLVTLFASCFTCYAFFKVGSDGNYCGIFGNYF